MKNKKRSDLYFERLLEESVRSHGHLCPGQVLGVRMSLCGLEKVGIADPKGRDKKNVIVFVEMDRCATDAIRSVTGCSLGKRTMKFFDYGKMAATFLNLKTGKAVRISAREDARGKAKKYFPEIKEKYEAQINAYKIMSERELFDCMEVSVSISHQDMPGKPVSRVQCGICGEYIQDKREIYRNGIALCRPCVDGGYYKCNRFFSESVMQNSHNDLDIRSKLWIESSGEPVFGRGRMMLLRAIEKDGSISQAAKAINISYRRAWSYLKAMEERLGIKLVERQTGGRRGGGTVLTDDAREFLRKYETLERGVINIVDQRFKRIFSGGNDV
jgi:formylmethanofuran dehydrogenase subunit E